MENLIPSFLAGLLTILAPCTLTILPILLGGSLTQKNPYRPLIIASSLGLSIFIFTLALKTLTFAADIPMVYLQILSGGLILIFGTVMLFPTLWDRLSIALKLYKTEELISKTSNKEGITGAIILGAALGPVFTTCSPTYLLILGTVLPASFALGALNLFVYCLGLALMLISIGYGGRAIATKFRFIANPNGWFKRILAILLIFTGISIMTGLDKIIETKIIESGYLGPIEIEENIIKGMKS